MRTSGGPPKWAAFAPAAIWAVLIFALSSRSDVGPPPGVPELPFLDKVEHFAEYGVLGFLLLFGIRKGPRLPWPVSPDFHAHLAFFIATVYAFTDEVHQAFVPMRRADGLDLLFDALGAFTAAFVFSSLLPPAAPPLQAPDRELKMKPGKVRYMVQGKGPPILYLHGWHGSKRYFAHAPARLPGYQHLAPDMLGFGASEAPARFSYAPRDQAQVVRALARSLGITSAVVVGHSMGGAVAVALALEDPSFVKALVLVEPAVRLPVPYPFLLVREDIRRIGFGFLRHFLGVRTRVFVHLMVEEEANFPRPLLEDALSVPFHASARSLARLFRNDLGHHLEEVNAPALLVFGDRGHPVREKYARLLEDEIPNASLLHIPHTSHCPMVEAPADFYEVVGEFMRESGVSPAAPP